ncbi:agmatinase family protein [Halegenticoccus tardaugens]|uniref:agmatinase family protein n=1 Tax=Halegenticoccus tardaugens TaxID=2071624 RepID=UPI00100B8736|nr:agmatinase family protein [Halegenticoccus tardaugens]
MSNRETGLELSERSRNLLSPYGEYEIGIEDGYDVNVGEIVTDFREADTADVGIVGIPFDTACVAGARGSRYGPNGVREKLTHGTCYNPELDIDISEGLDIVDFGDVKVTHTDVLETHDRVETVLTDLSKKGIFPVSVGGDHSLSYPTVKALMNATDGQVGVINVDAHHDVRHSHGDELSSGTPFRRLLEDESGQLNHENFVELGLSGWHNSQYYVNWLVENGSEIITAREIHRSGVDPAVERALDAATDGTEAVFLSVDIDVLDSGTAPGTCAPSPGGLLNYQLLELVYQLGRHPLVKGADLMEVAPPLDTNDITSMIGAAVLTQFLGARKAIQG